MAKWRHDVSAQYVGNVLSALTLISIGGAAGIFYWAWKSTSGPVLATIAFVLFVACLVLLFLRVNYERDKKPTASSEDQASLAQLRSERDALAKVFERAEQQITGRNEIIAQKDEIIQQRADFIDKLAPKVQWADGLIDRERDFARRYLKSECRLGQTGHLSDNEPYFDIDILIDYCGALRLAVGQAQPGKLAWQGQAFALPPQVTHAQGEPLPFEGDGPTACWLKIRQYLTTGDRAAEIKSYLDRGVVEFEFGTKDFNVSITLKDFAGTMVAESALIGTELTAKVRV
jgi:hypothetical protein